MITNPRILYENRISMEIYPDCLLQDEKAKAMHLSPDSQWLDLIANTCVGLLFQTIEYATQNDTGRNVIRKMPSFQYKAWKAPDNFVIQYDTGWFMSIPIGHFGYWRVYSNDMSETDKTIAALDKLNEQVRRIEVVNWEDVDG